MINEYERLHYVFEDYLEKTLIDTSTNEENEVLSQSTTHQKYKKSKVPKIYFYFSRIINDPIDNAPKMVIELLDCTKIKTN